MSNTHGRAKRIPLTLDVAYRFVGETEWSRGRMLNVSESGVLFGPTRLMAGLAIEVIFTTPVLIGSIPPGRVICAAHVVRSTAAGGAAARFDEWRFLLDG